MAGLPWFKVYSSIARHPKTRALEESTGNAQALAFLLRLFSWFSDYAPRGRTARGRRADGARTARVLERACEWTGAEGDLVAALLDIGWLEQDGPDFVLHDWDDVQGAHLAKAEKDAERKRSARLRAREAGGRGGAVAVDGARTARGRRADGAGRVEESRVEESRGDLPPTPQSAEQQPLLMVEPTPVATAKDLQGLWNRLAKEFGLALWVGMGEGRQQKTEAALKVCGDLTRWESWLRSEFKNPWMLGQNDREWCADVKWLLKVENRDKVLDFDPDRAPPVLSPARVEDAEQAEIADLFAPEGEV